MQLNDFLASRGGRVSFRAFQEAALYDPEFGYYTTQIRTVGRGGDFSTSATLHSGLAQAIAKWILSESEALGGVRDVIEVGGGDGSLAGAVLGALGWWRGRKFRYHIVEASPALTTIQQSQLARRRTHWHTEMQTAIEAAHGSAIVISNELVDAFPATLLQWDGEENRWLEVFLESRPGGKLAEVLDSPEDPTSIPKVDAWQPADGQRCEVLASYRDWLGAWLPGTEKIGMLTIDYGDVFPDLYARRPAGTVRGYFQHNPIHDLAVYERFGKQDITCDVNFSDLQCWGNALGAETVGFETQRDFAMNQLGDDAAGEAAGEFILAEEGAGSAFKVLHQRKR